MSGITEELASLLSTVTRPGDFYAFGRTEWLAPRLEVKDVGIVAFPGMTVMNATATELPAIGECSVEFSKI